MRSRASYAPLILLLLLRDCVSLRTAIDSPKALGLLDLDSHDVATKSTSSVYTTSTPDSRVARADVGTKDAPVDGMDGKPHSGPFVDGSAESVKVKEVNTLPAKKQDTTVIEDGVMNDPNRQLPKKGTTGVEGGVSEKERDRKASEAAPGRKPLKKPDPPKEPIAAPHEKPPRVEKAESAGKQAVVDRLAGADAEKPRGAPGIGVRFRIRRMSSHIKMLIQFLPTRSQRIFQTHLTIPTSLTQLAGRRRLCMM